jgi:hypothetical protein
MTDSPAVAVADINARGSEVAQENVDIAQWMMISTNCPF